MLAQSITLTLPPIPRICLFAAVSPAFRVKVCKGCWPVNWFACRSACTIPMPPTLEPKSNTYCDFFFPKPLSAPSPHWGFLPPDTAACRLRSLPKIPLSGPTVPTPSESPA